MYSSVEGRSTFQINICDCDDEWEAVGFFRIINGGMAPNTYMTRNNRKPPGFKDSVGICRIRNVPAATSCVSMVESQWSGNSVDDGVIRFFPSTVLLLLLLLLL